MLFQIYQLFFFINESIVAKLKEDTRRNSNVYILSRNYAGYLQTQYDNNLFHKTFSFLMFLQMKLVKRCAIISYKHSIYELVNVLRLRIF